MLNKLLLTYLVFVIVGCSNLSKNLVKEGSVTIKNGTFAEKVWKERLIFDRYSWYHELNLHFDLMVAEVLPQSSFNFWFSKDELEIMNKCEDARVVMVYSLDTRNIPYSTLYDQFEKSGYTRFELLEFKKHITQHPDAEILGLRLYHIFGICNKKSAGKSININIPGYSETVLN